MILKIFMLSKNIQSPQENDANLRAMGGANVMRSNVKRQPGNNLGTYRQSFYFPSLIDSYRSIQGISSKSRSKLKITLISSS
jgi:hypothetical protein